MIWKGNELAINFYSAFNSMKALIAYFVFEF